jgi:hypothetical protein
MKIGPGSDSGIKENNEKTKKDRIRILNPHEFHHLQAYRRPVAGRR